MEEQEFTGAVYHRYLNEHQLMGARCQECGSLYLPPRPLCPACLGTEMAWVPLSGKGRLKGFSVIHFPTAGMAAAGYGRDKPYCSGIVELEEGPSISAQILNVDTSQPQSIVIGTPVQAAFVERGEGDTRTTVLAFEAT